MKKSYTYLLILVLASWGIIGIAQKPHNPKANLKKTMSNKQLTGFETNETATISPLKNTDLSENAQTRSVSKEAWIGSTDYDLQTNNTVANRLARKASGESVMTWTKGTGDLNSGIPNRGTGYNMFDAAYGAWNTEPDERLEANTRTGWPNTVIAADGTEFIVNHSSNNVLHTLRREVGEANWTEGSIPSMVTPGLLWPRAANSGNNIHVIAVSTPVANGGAIWLDMEPALLYYRSADAGETWEVTDFQIPGITSDEFVRLGIDAYSIDADNAGNVAIGIFNAWGDVVLLKSIDHGATWAKRIINDFPLDVYNLDGYTLDDIGGVVDPNGPVQFENPEAVDSLAIFTSDRSGAVSLGSDGMAHVVFSQMYVSDIDFTDQNWTFWPGWTGISYWNESMDDNAHQTITAVDEATDIDGDGTYNIDGEIASYFVNLTSFPNIEVDDDGHIMLAYSMLMESHIKENSTPEANQHYRHVWLTVSSDNGTTWEIPYHTNNEDVVLFTPLIDTREVVFPDLLFNSGSSYSLSYQIDDEPGLHARGDDDPVNSNTIAVWDFDKYEIFPGTFPNNISNTLMDIDLKFQVYPNPVSDIVSLQYELPEAGHIQISIQNMIGQEVKMLNQGRQSNGVYNLSFDVNDWSSGLYIVNLRMDDYSTSEKLIIGR